MDVQPSSAARDREINQEQRLRLELRRLHRHIAKIMADSLRLLQHPRGPLERDQYLRDVAQHRQEILAFREELKRFQSRSARPGE